MKMRIIFFFFLLTCIRGYSQDSLLSKNSWEFTASANMIMPAQKEYTELRMFTDYILNAWWTQYNPYTITPKSSVNPYFRAKLNRVFYEKRGVTLTFSPSFGYKLSEFKDNEVGAISIFTYPPAMTSISKTVRRNYIQASISFGSDIKLCKKWVLCNQLLLGTDYLFYEKAKEINTPANSNPYIPYLSPYTTYSYSHEGAFENVVLSYEFGIKYELNNNISLSPSVKFPLFYFNTLWEKFDNPYLVHYKTMEAGVSICFRRTHRK